MIKLFVNPKREKVKKKQKTSIEIKAAQNPALANPPKKLPEPRELFWDGYSDIGYC